ncbi:MAG TPA: CGNR zinc finger domain-containing protein [Gemmatimonadales bacterium]|jgi:predicted RNA-binding Zn ribbon-like protein|nr:CGNR zinc finger domain-containing protein [Gemmatimonadales bacterium]
MSTSGREPLIAGHPALDFTNSVGWHAGANQEEHFHSYGDLLDWAGDAKVLTPQHLASLGRKAAAQPAAARAALRRAIAIREVIYRVFSAVARGRTPARDDLERLHAGRIEALRHATIQWSGALANTFAKCDDLLAPVYPVVLAAVELLQSDELARVRQCANDPCGWLFVDRSRNGSRRWCSSSDCGNESRVRRFRARSRRQAPGAER